MGNGHAASAFKLATQQNGTTLWSDIGMFTHPKKPRHLTIKRIADDAESEDVTKVNPHHLIELLLNHLQR